MILPHKCQDDGAPNCVCRAAAKCSPAGFTLLEMLVVLVIIGLLSVLLLQGLGMIFHLRSGFADQLNHLEEGALQEHWFRSSVSSLIPDYPPETEHEVFFQAADPHTFQGDELGFHGLTLAALDAAPAVPMPFSWRLLYDGNTHLLYDNAQGETWKIMRWQGNSGGFFYLDQSGKKHRQWPPDADSPQLPQAIQLSGQRRQQAFTWLVTIPGRKNPPPDLRLEPIF